MDYQRNVITGIDIPIYAFQSYLYSQLRDKWNCTDSSFNMYGRAYRNQTQDGYTPELFIGGQDYYDTFFDDTLSANSFFGVGDITTVKDGSSTADCFLIFCVNLSKIKPGDDRNDEAAHIDVQKLVIGDPYGFRSVGWVTGIDSVFREYSGWKKSDGIKFRDEHPYHCFRLNFKLLYNINDC